MTPTLERSSSRRDCFVYDRYRSEGHLLRDLAGRRVVNVPGPIRNPVVRLAVDPVPDEVRGHGPILAVFGPEPYDVVE